MIHIYEQLRMGQHMSVHNNWIMLSERIGIVWGFGNVKARCLKSYLLKLILLSSGCSTIYMLE
jgi:hypothetical protein